MTEEGDFMDSKFTNTATRLMATLELRFIMVAVCLILLSGCAALGIEICGTGATRCRGNTVQVCKSGFGWSDAVNCENLATAESEAWSCGAPKGVCQDFHQCMPPEPEKK